MLWQCMDMIKLFTSRCLTRNIVHIFRSEPFFQELTADWHTRIVYIIYVIWPATYIRYTILCLVSNMYKYSLVHINLIRCFYIKVCNVHGLSCQFCISGGANSVSTELSR